MTTYIWPDVADPSKHANFWVALQFIEQSTRRVSSHYSQFDGRDVFFNPPENFSGKKQNRIFVRKPIHGSGKNQTVRFYPFFTRRKVLSINTSRNCKNILQRKFSLKIFLVNF